MANGLLGIKKSAVALGALLALAPGVSHAWWNGDWSVRKKITVNAPQADIKDTVSQAPLLVRLHTGNFDFASAKDNGADIRFVAGDDKTPLNYHIEKFDAVNEMALVWVQSPKLAASKQEAIYLYYGNSKANAADNAANSYDANMSAVYHFGEKDTPKDATGNSNQPAVAAIKLGDGSLIGGGATLDGQGALTLAASPSLKVAASQGLTVSAWIKPSSVPANAVLFQLQDGAKAVTLGIEAGKLYAATAAAGTPKTTDIPAGAWHHVALVAGKTLTLYLDGKEAATAAVALEDMQGGVTIGKGYAGEIDEIEIANTVRTADWIKVAALGQGADALLLAYGEDETQGSEGGSSSYFATILHSVTLDGWVVIGILMVMAVISWLVMAIKALVIGKIEKGNKTFLQDYKQLAVTETGRLDADEDEDEEDSPLLTALNGKQDDFRHSPLYRIYHTGVQEIKHRFGSAEPGQKFLTPQAIGAIKSSLDATLVRENQKLNSQMVLLTIAISGGPFLGLLGTVVGVMITFAAIAATGDVNVAAIAPGIAAALVATVAGLGVAIPALFGYNYIGSKIKNVTADMHVFSDEFVSRITEVYSR